MISLFSYYYFQKHVLPLPLLKLQLGHDVAVSLQMFIDAPNYFRAISIARVLQSDVAQLIRTVTFTNTAREGSILRSRILAQFVNKNDNSSRPIYGLKMYKYHYTSLNKQ